MLEAMAIVFLGLTCFDYWFTHRRMLKHGIEVELNPIVKLASKLFGPVKGLVLTGLAPSLAIVAATLMRPIELGWVLIFLTGYRVAFFNVQLAGLAFEKQIEEIIANLQKKPPEG